jgi:dipeptidase D
MVLIILDYRFRKFYGGSLRNAIPRESVATVIIAEVYDEAFVYDMQQIVNDIKTELKTTEPNLEVFFEKLDSAPDKVMPLLRSFILLERCMLLIMAFII